MHHINNSIVCYKFAEVINYLKALVFLRQCHEGWQVFTEDLEFLH